MSIDFSPSTGLEKIGRQAFLTLFATLNAEIYVQTSIWAPLDEELGEIREISISPVYLEPVEDENFHLGHRPSLIEAPIDEYPNCSVMAYQAEPSGDIHDHFSSFFGGLFVELMVKSPLVDADDRELLHDAEEEVNKRIQRTTDAVLNVLMRDRTLGGTIQELQGPPTALVTDVFTRRESAGHGDTWLWQGARLDFTFERLSTYS